MKTLQGTLLFILLAIFSSSVVCASGENLIREYPVVSLGVGILLDLSGAGIDDKYVRCVASYVPVSNEFSAISLDALLLLNLDRLSVRVPVVAHLLVFDSEDWDCYIFLGAGAGFDFSASVLYGILESGFEILIVRGVILEMGCDATTLGFDHSDFEIFGSILFFF
jgi:hypothetical protein